MIVIPDVNQITLSKSQLKYFSSDSSEYVGMQTNFAVSENNTISIPNYMLVLSDVYGNVISSFPSD